MARIDNLAQFILSFEGGFVDDPQDSGGATNMGVTLRTWKSQGYDKNGDGKIDIADLRRITEEDAVRILKLNYWNRWQADRIENQSVANLVVDWTWNSGAYGIKIPQRVLGVETDGIVGEKTLSALNAASPKDLFHSLHEERRRFLERIVAAAPEKRKFLNGWMRRLLSITYGSLILNNGIVINA